MSIPTSTFTVGLYAAPCCLNFLLQEYTRPFLLNYSNEWLTHSTSTDLIYMIKRIEFSKKTKYVLICTFHNICNITISILYEIDLSSYTASLHSMGSIILIMYPSWTVYFIHFSFYCLWHFHTLLLQTRICTACTVNMFNHYYSHEESLHYNLAKKTNFNMYCRGHAVHVQFYPLNPGISLLIITSENIAGKM